MTTKLLKFSGENGSIYRVKPLWKDNSFEVTFLLENSSAWHADITEELLTKSAKDRAQNISDYYDTIKRCLTNPEPEFSFDLKQNGKSGEDNGEFLIKRKIGGRTVLFFNIKLKKLDFQKCVFDLIDELLENNFNLNEELGKVNEKQAALVEERKMYENKLTEFVELKTNWEQEMYSNFLILLNEKKKRIKFLTDILTHKNINPDEVQVPEIATVPSPEPSQAPPRRIETLSESGTESEYETDKENEGMEIEEDPSPKPSTSKRILDLEDDEPPRPVLSLPKLAKSSQSQPILMKKKIKETSNLTGNILTQETQEIVTQEPYLSTQERIDRM